MGLRTLDEEAVTKRDLAVIHAYVQPQLAGAAARYQFHPREVRPVCMVKRRSKKQSVVAQDGLLTGQLLIAMPAMDTPDFVQAVIYLCAHTSDGAMGIVLNRPLASPSFEDLLEKLQVLPRPPARRIDLFRGGPVESGRGFVLHTTDWSGDGSLDVDGTVALTASLEVLKAIADGGGPSRGLLALGYAAWGPGQLDQEMQDNLWLSAPPPSIDLLFDGDHTTKWRRAMGILRIDPVLLSGAAGHA